MKESECIFFQLSKTTQTAIKFLGQKVAPLGVTPIQSLILRFIAEEDGLTATALARRSELDMATLTGIIDRLEGAGIIERKTNPEDRRSLLICLTSRGKDMAQKVGEIIEEANQEFTEHLNEEERSKIFNLLARLRQSAD